MRKDRSVYYEWVPIDCAINRQMRFQVDLMSFGNIDWGLTQMFHNSILIIPTVIFLYKYFLYGIEIMALD